MSSILNSVTTNSISIFKSRYQTYIIAGITESASVVFVRRETKVDNLEASFSSQNVDYMSSQDLLKGENSHSKQALPCCAVCGDTTLLLAGADGIINNSRLLFSHGQLQFWWDTCIFWQQINLGAEMPFLPFSTNCIFICPILPNFCQSALTPVPGSCSHSPQLANPNLIYQVVHLGPNLFV